MASCACRLGLKPYEHGAKSASKIGSSTNFKNEWSGNLDLLGRVRPMGVVHR
jgi:hypothetical protein